tara:strand:- start:3772 stop:3999 length:228 start_codon:yes stop_codon:yes gene_type:complete
MIKMIMQKIKLNNRFKEHDYLVKDNFQNSKQNVDINMLLNRVKMNKKIEIKKKIIFTSLVILAISLSGFFLSIMK